jgi:alkylation response protein AidB-like acyl-CoA dehydrogenase
MVGPSGATTGKRTNRMESRTMDFRISDEQRQMVAMVREVSQHEFKPNAARYHDGSFPWDNLKRLGELGVTGMAVPKEYGGLGLGTLDVALVLEELAKGCYATAMMMLGELGVQTRIISSFAPESLKRRMLPKIATGEFVLAICITEPDAGSDAGAMRTNTNIDGDRAIVNGMKTMISRAEEADVFIVFTRVNNVPGGKGVGCVLVEKGAVGLSAKASFHTMGGEMLSEVRFDDVVVAEENVISREGGTKKMFTAFNMQRCLNSAICLGLAEGAFNESVRYLRDRSAFGSRIGDYQGQRWRLANMYRDIEAARGLLYRACVSGDPFPDPRQAALAKIYCNEMAVQVTDEARKIHGGYGYTDEFAVSHFFRQAPFGGSGGGTPDLLRNMVGKALIDDFDLANDFAAMNTF